MRRQDVDYDALAQKFLEDNDLHEEKFNYFSYFMEFITALCWVLGGLLIAPFFLLLAKKDSEEDDA
jgi:hypothetical protein